LTLYSEIAHSNGLQLHREENQLSESNATLLSINRFYASNCPNHGCTGMYSCGYHTGKSHKSCNHLQMPPNMVDKG